MKQTTILVLCLGLVILAGGFYVYNTDETSFKGTTTVGLTIIYEDGTERTFDSTRNPLSAFLPLKISDTGGEISSLKVTVKVKPTFSGSYTSSSLDNSWLTMVITSPTGGGTKSFKSYGDTAFSTPTFTSESWANILTKTFSASSIETACGTYGSYSMSIDCGVYLKMAFGTTENTKSATTSSIWGFKYEADAPSGVLSSISISIGKSSLR